MTKPNATLLVVDDDAMNLDALSRCLMETGYRVLTAENGADALDLINTHHVDAVLLDIMMPGMSGIETLISLRQSRSVSDLPVIMVSAKNDSDDVVEALDHGANDYVTKPIDYAVALARIRTQVMARRADPLTGLPNRVLFSEKINALLKHEGAAERQPFAVLFIDVDRFKVVNDSLGHAAGDELLVALATRLQHALRSTDGIARMESDQTLARIGGDEFTILLNGVGDASAATAVAERLRTVCARPFQVHGREIVTSLSIGMVMSADRYRRAEDMIRDADNAMYRAKKLGKGRFEVFDSSMFEAAQERLLLEADLRLALERHEFQLLYQPIVSLAEGRVTGFEALIRWHHPLRGLISPIDFIPLAEDTGLIVPIGNWVLREACEQLKTWDREHSDTAGLVVNVNLSARQCLHPDLLQDVERILIETGFPAERVKLEITEGVVLENSDAVSKILHDLRALGVQLGLDDFGMGYSALSYLQRFPFQTIKIDRTFVSAMKETGNAEIIRAIVSMAAGLDMNVTAEGVETADQVIRLKDLACEFGQGFYFHKPLSVAEARAMLDAGVLEKVSAP